MYLAPMTMRFTPTASHLERKHVTTCLLCHRGFLNGDTTHLGYSADGRSLCVGDCCSGALVETAIRHSFLAQPFETPQSHILLWRYMDFAKYVGLLSARSLFFCRLDKLEDPYEGAMGAEGMRERWCAHYLERFREAIRNPPLGYICDKTSEQVEADAQRLLFEFRNGNEKKTRSVFATCWYENEHESDAMWRLFSQQSQYAVAVQTTVGRLRKCLDRETTIGRVRYIDYDKEYPDIGFPHFFKRRAFEHEREVRAAILDIETPTDCEGKAVGVDLDRLIVAVRVSPLSPSWFRTVVQNVTAKYDLDAEILASSLSQKAFR
jgi:hypothetical protein